VTTAVITGGAGDIGMALCTTLGKAGYRIAVVDIEPRKCDSADMRLRDEGIKAFAAPCDITDSSAVAAMARVVLVKEDVAVVVNNAGKASAPTFERGNEADWLEAQAINLNGAYFVTRNFLPHMQAKRRGVVINVASLNGRAAHGNPAYSVAKAGLIQFTKMLAFEYGQFGIRAVTIVPGTVRTQAWNERLLIKPDILEELVKWSPLGRVSEPQDVANVAAFAVSDLAAAITGSEITVDCGASAGNLVAAGILLEAGG
jgi:NAD(P)-dependent dehydrogenase (short-subunit alcohol dehydrogenase family)